MFYFLVQQPVLFISDLIQSLLQVGDDVVNIFNAYGHSDKVGLYAAVFKLLVGKLTMGGACGMQSAGAGVGNMDDELCQLKSVHELHCLFSAALYAEGDNAAASAGHILLCSFIILAALKTGIVDPFDLVVLFKILCNSKCV